MKSLFAVTTHTHDVAAFGEPLSTLYYDRRKFIYPGIVETPAEAEASFKQNEEAISFNRSRGLCS